MDQLYGRHYPTRSRYLEPKGNSFRAEDIPLGTAPMWPFITRTHGAVAWFENGNTCTSFFPDQQATLGFSWMSTNELDVPKICDQKEETRVEYDERMTSFANIHRSCKLWSLKVPISLNMSFSPFKPLFEIEMSNEQIKQLL